MSIRSTSQKRGRLKNNRKKRKAEKFFNVNLYIIKIRKRLENMSAAEKEWESIKRSNKYDLKKYENKFKNFQK